MNCLRNIFQQEQPTGGVEVIVADGMSNDGTRELLARFAIEEPRLRVIDNHARITPVGLNAAIAAARGAIIVRMDAHTEYAPDYIKECVAALDSKGADNVGGAARTRALGYRQRAVAAAYHCPLVIGGSRFHNEAYEGWVDTVTYGCWRRQSFETFGLFDEELIRNQDDEHNLRITRQGGRIWQSAAIRSWYHPRTSLSALFQQYMQYGYWKVRVIQKHRLPASWRHVVPGSFLLALVGFGLLAIFSKTALVLWVLVAIAYVSANLLGSLGSAQRAGLDLLPILPAVVGCYHFGYGYGFLRGIWDFVIWRKGCSASFAALTRDPQQHG